MIEYSTLPVPFRISQLREELFATETRICFHRARIVTESYRATEGKPWVIRRAKALCAIFDKMPVFIREGELLVGQRASILAGRSVYPEYNLSDLSDDNAPKEILDYWQGKTLRDEVYNAFPQAVIDAEKELAAAYCTGSGTGFGHVIVDYEKALRIGFVGIAEEARERQSAIPESDRYGRDFLEAVILTADGIMRWAARYADCAENEAARTTDPARRIELTQIADVCRRVPGRPANTFHEALQSFWFTHLALHLEQYGWSISAGRFDQYMLRFFKNDVREGRLTLEGGWEHLLGLWIKFMENVGTEFGKTVFQNLTLGGQNENGEDQSNELSDLCLDATVALKLNQPALSVRWHRNINPQFWQKVHRTIAQGLGFPALFSDEVIIKALTTHGVPLAEATGYGIVGCVEACVPGRQQGVTAGGHLNVAKALELALNEGKSMITGVPIGEPTPAPEEFTDFSDLWQAYERQVRYLASVNILASQIAGTVQKRRGHCPLMSSLLDDCIAAGRDLVDGATRYNLPGISIFGNSNVYDGMNAIRRIICEEKRATWGELRLALQTDFEGREDLRRLLSQGVSRFGNDSPEVDALANTINAVHADFFWSHTDARGGRFVCGVWPVEGHVHSGYRTAATPDGRHCGTPLADGVGACHGADINGPTALLNSVAKLDHSGHWAAGNTCNIKFPAAIMSTYAGIDLLHSLVSVYFETGGQQLQINVVDADTLKAAQLNPREFENLIVRVAGFSAYFTRLSRDVQNEIISRTEHSLSEVG